MGRNHHDYSYYPLWPLSNLVRTKKRPDVLGFRFSASLPHHLCWARTAVVAGLVPLLAPRGFVRVLFPRLRFARDALGFVLDLPAGAEGLVEARFFEAFDSVA